MSKKDYKAIARILRFAGSHTNPQMQWNYIQGEIAAYFARNSSKFNRSKFNAACCQRPEENYPTEL